MSQRVPAYILSDILFACITGEEPTLLSVDAAPAPPLPAWKDARGRNRDILVRRNFALTCRAFAEGARALKLRRLFRWLLRDRCLALAQRAEYSLGLVMRLRPVAAALDGVLRAAHEDAIAAAARAVDKIARCSCAGSTHERFVQVLAHAAGNGLRGDTARTLVSIIANGSTVLPVGQHNAHIATVLLCESMAGASTQYPPTQAWWHCKRNLRELLPAAMDMHPVRAIEMCHAADLDLTRDECRLALSVSTRMAPAVLNALPFGMRTDPAVFGPSCLRHPDLLLPLRTQLRVPHSDELRGFFAEFAARHGRVRRHRRNIPWAIRGDLPLMRAAFAAAQSEAERQGVRAAALRRIRPLLGWFA